MSRAFVLVGFLILVVVYGFSIAKMTYYECPNCQAHFKRDAWDLLKPHFFGKREESCPQCGQKSMMFRHFGKE